ncbi:hypothetical protein QJS66_21680 [Kocuria rhizophila]|nr:hypothetical protein QJS66_21680 [Kocuria rhizophila]
MLDVDPPALTRRGDGDREQAPARPDPPIGTRRRRRSSTGRFRYRLRLLGFRRTGPPPADVVSTGQWCIDAPRLDELGHPVARGGGGQPRAGAVHRGCPAGLHARCW